MTRTIKIESDYEITPWDKVPIILKAISGFNSCLTVSAMSVLFIWSIHIGITTNKTDWPGFITWLLMCIGPIIITLNFVNARSIITTMVGSPSTDENEESVIENNDDSRVGNVVIPPAVGLISARDIAFEREIVGPTTVIMRAIAGFISTHVICFCSLLFTWTIHETMIVGHTLPGDPQLFMVVIGPIITSWNFVRANATLSTVIHGASQLDKWRDRIGDFISTKK